MKNNEKSYLANCPKSDTSVELKYFAAEDTPAPETVEPASIEEALRQEQLGGASSGCVVLGYFLQHYDFAALSALAVSGNLFGFHFNN